MSGIVGSAGSKSGVIGTTELDYEEGTWTPAITSSTNVISIAGGTTRHTYIRIGNMCHFVMELTAVTLSGTNTASDNYIEGLPFTCNARTATTILNQYGSLFTTTITGMISHNTQKIELVKIAAPYGSGNFNNTTSATYWMIAGTYEIA